MAERMATNGRGDRLGGGRHRPPRGNPRLGRGAREDAAPRPPPHPSRRPGREPPPRRAAIGARR